MSRVVSPRRRSAAAQLAEAAPVFAALGDETRLRIITRLCADGPLSIARLTDGATISRQAVTKHLHALSKARLVRSERTGREHVWSVETARLAEVHRYLGEISARWDEALGRLQALVEEG